MDELEPYFVLLNGLEQVCLGYTIIRRIREIFKYMYCKIQAPLKKKFQFKNLKTCHL